MRAKSVKLKIASNEYVDDKEKIEFYKNEIKRLKEAIAWTYEVSESINERAAHTCRYYLYKRLRDCEKPSEPKALF
jgi:hypothetical protein